MTDLVCLAFVLGGRGGGGEEEGEGGNPLFVLAEERMPQARTHFKCLYYILLRVYDTARCGAGGWRIEYKGTVGILQQRRIETFHWQAGRQASKQTGGGRKGKEEGVGGKYDDNNKNAQAWWSENDSKTKY